MWELNWVVTPADGPFVGSVSLFIFEKVLRNQEIGIYREKFYSYIPFSSVFC